MSGGNEENHENLQLRYCPGQDLNRTPPEALPAEPTCSVTLLLLLLLLLFINCNSAYARWQCYKNLTYIQECCTIW
jgi:hypothetical protein